MSCLRQLPGEFMRGRQTRGMLTVLGVEELIVTSIDEYLTLARRLATDKQLRTSVSQKILANAGRLFNDSAPPIALGQLLLTLVPSQDVQSPQK